jgi:uncharacterized coiled-coil DUF342 family protein
MLDSLKTLGAGKGQPSATAELQALIATAREERAALSEMLTQVSLRSTKLAQIGKSLDEVGKKATGATECVEAVTQRLTNLDDRTKGVEEIEARMTQFLTTVMQARQDVESIVGPGSELQKHRDEVQQLSSRALQIQSSLDALKQEQVALEDLRNQFRQTQAAAQRTLDQVGSLTSDVDRIQTVAARLAEDYARLQDTSREASHHSHSAMDTLEQIEKKLGSLAVLQEQTKGIVERLATVNALAEHVSLKAKALESQKHMVDRAVVEANRLNEMVRAMDLQIQRLNEGNGQIATTEQMLGRVEKLAQETARQLDSALKVKDAFRHDIGRLEKETTTLADSVRGHLERWSIDKKEFDGMDQRLRALQAAVSRAELRIDTVGASDKAIGQLAHGAETLSKHLHELSAQIRRAYGEAVVAPGAAGPTDRGRGVVEEEDVPACESQSEPVRP